jgi:chromosomal replication initiator protein
MYLCRKHTGSSYPEIGNALGGKDHTTALNAYNRIKERIDDPEVRRHLDEVERMLQGE